LFVEAPLVVASNILSDSGHVHIYDSLHANINKQCIEQATNMFGVEDDNFACIPSAQTQSSTTDCGNWENKTVLILYVSNNITTMSREVINDAESSQIWD